jgi:hypothetical protein
LPPRACVFSSLIPAPPPLPLAKVFHNFYWRRARVISAGGGSFFAHAASYSIGMKNDSNYSNNIFSGRSIIYSKNFSNCCHFSKGTRGGGGAHRIKEQQEASAE